jgi:hypothetical protein
MRGASRAATLLDEARRRITAASARGGRRTRLALAFAVLLAAALLGACLFGLGHVLIGGLVKGNWRAGGFGVALAGATGLALLVEVAILRRRLPADGSPKGD